MLQKIKNIFTKEYWNLKNISNSPRKMFLFKQMLIFRLALKGFTEDRVQVRASALTYYTMLSIVPIAAMVFGIASGFGIESKFQEIIHDTFTSQKEVATWVIDFSKKYLENIRGGYIAGVGVLVLFWSVIRLLSNIELSLNDIWQIKKSRVISRKLSDYISLVVIAPVLIVVSIAINVFLKQQVDMSDDTFPLIGYINPLLSILFNMLPFIFVWLVFTLIYIIMPNTKVKFKSALIGGVIAGTVFLLLNSVYINGQTALTSYGAIYGSFAALPLFLIWLQLSWLIVLFGAEVSFANQNIDHYEAETESFNISHHMKSAVSLIIVRAVALNFKEGLPAYTAEQLAKKLDLPIRLLRDIIYELLDVGILSETITKYVKDNAYQPACDIQKLSISFVLEALDKRGNDAVNTGNEQELDKMVTLVDSFSEELQKSRLNKLLVEI